MYTAQARHTSRSSSTQSCHLIRTIRHTMKPSYLLPQSRLALVGILVFSTSLPSVAQICDYAATNYVSADSEVTCPLELFPRRCELTFNLKLSRGAMMITHVSAVVRTSVSDALHLLELSHPGVGRVYLKPDSVGSIVGEFPSGGILNLQQYVVNAETRVRVTGTPTISVEAYKPAEYHVRATIIGYELTSPTRYKIDGGGRGQDFVLYCN